jgi:L-fuculose-phosphate aldolase
MLPKAAYNGAVDRLKRTLAVIPELYAQGLLDASGGNLAIRTSKGVFVTPSQAGEILRWKLGEEDFVLFPGEGDASMARAGRRPSRENRMHRQILAARPDWNFVYHGHPWGSLAFAIAGQPLPVPVAHSHLVQLNKICEIPLVDNLPSGSAQLAMAAVEAINAAFSDAAHAALLLAGHGIVVAGAEVESTLSLATGLENVARAQIWKLTTALR